MTTLLAVRDERKLQIKYEKNMSDVAWLKRCSDLEEKSSRLVSRHEGEVRETKSQCDRRRCSLLD